MAISRVTTWISGQVLTASALNGEFDNIINNGLSLISPLTGNLDFNGFRAQNFSAGTVGSPSGSFSGDGTTGFYRSAAGVYDIAAAGVRAFSVSSVAGATAYVAVGHAAASAIDAATIGVGGTATNANLTFSALGTGYPTFPGGRTVGSSILPGLAVGSEASGLSAITSGTIDLLVNARRVAQLIDAASATNYLTVTSAATGSAPTISAAGADTNVGLTLDTKAGGALTLGSSDTGGITAATYFVPAAFSWGAADTPAQHGLYQNNVIKAWQTFDGATGAALKRGFNVTSTTRNGVGRYTLTFGRAFTATPYVIMGSGKYDSSSVNGGGDPTRAPTVGFHNTYPNPATTSCVVGVANMFGGAPVDAELVTVAFLGDQ